GLFSFFGCIGGLLYFGVPCVFLHPGAHLEFQALLLVLQLDLVDLAAQPPAVGHPASQEDGGTDDQVAQSGGRHPCSIILAKRWARWPTCRAQAESSMPRAAAA